MTAIINAEVFEVLYVKAIVLQNQFEDEKKLYLELDTDCYNSENDYLNFSNVMRNMNDAFDLLHLIICKIRLANNITIRQSTMETVAKNVCAEYDKITDIMTHNNKLQEDLMKISEYIAMFPYPE